MSFMIVICVKGRADAKRGLTWGFAFASGHRLRGVAGWPRVLSPMSQISAVTVVIFLLAQGLTGRLPIRPPLAREA